MTVSEMMSSADAEQLRAIWDEVAVGASGFLDMKELSIVCEHIGMDSIEEKVVVFSFLLCHYVHAYQYTSRSFSILFSVMGSLEKAL